MDPARSLPEGCPPTGHVAADGTFYRLTRAGLLVGDTPPDDDWLLPVQKKRSEAYQRFDRCDAFAHSVFGDVQVLVDAQVLVPWARKKSISSLALVPDMGRILESPSDLGQTHHDWWPASDSLVPEAVVIKGGAG